MFSYHVPDGGIQDVVTQNEFGDIKFDPPVYQQRYATTLLILKDSRWSEHLKKIVDFGCGEMRLLPMLRRIDGIEHIMAVDIDEETLVSRQNIAFPLISDYLKKRERPLRVEVFRGSITDSVENLRNVDAVIALEVIEHLMPDVLEKVPQNIFGFMQPKLAIFSTPNRDYNILFNGLNANGFRIDDHKFEWTREEFRNWASKICEQYPNYSVAYHGIGSPPLNQKNLGHVTQMAIFARNDIINCPLRVPLLAHPCSNPKPEVQFKEIYLVEIPCYIDERSIIQKIKDETCNFLHYYQSNNEYYVEDREVYQIPIAYLNKFALSINAKEEDVLKALQELNLKVENNFIILTEEYIEENYRANGKHFYEDDELYHFDRDKDESSAEKTYRNVSDDESEECWD